MSKLPEAFQVRDVSEYEKEPFENYLARIRLELPSWPECVLKQWLYSNNESPNYELSESTFRKMRFASRTLTLDEIPDCSCIRTRGFGQIANNSYGEDDEKHAKTAAERWPKNHYTADDLSDFIFLKGTWPVPIILADNSNSEKCFDDGEPLKAPWHLLEGHHRLAWLLAMKNQGVAKTRHEVWIANW